MACQSKATAAIVTESPSVSLLTSTIFSFRDHLRIIGITASNTWGLLLLILLMGYGLVELPRNAWNMSIPGHKLSHTLFKISKLSTEKEDVEEQLADILEVWLALLCDFAETEMMEERLVGLLQQKSKHKDCDDDHFVCHHQAHRKREVGGGAPAPSIIC